MNQEDIFQEHVTVKKHCIEYEGKKISFKALRNIFS
jgi:hypothetical protein